MAAVCLLLGEKPDWAAAKRALSDHGFSQRLLALDPVAAYRKEKQRKK